jgi:hypothetical protein
MLPKQRIQRPPLRVEVERERRIRRVVGPTSSCNTLMDSLWLSSDVSPILLAYIVVNLNGMVAESHPRPLLREANWFGSSHSSLPLHFPGAQ